MSGYHSLHVPPITNGFIFLCKMSFLHPFFNASLFLDKQQRFLYTADRCRFGYEISYAHYTSAVLYYTKLITYSLCEIFMYMGANLSYTYGMMLTRLRFDWRPSSASARQRVTLHHATVIYRGLLVINNMIDRVE